MIEMDSGKKMTNANGSSFECNVPDDWNENIDHNGPAASDANATAMNISMDCNSRSDFEFMLISTQLLSVSTVDVAAHGVAPWICADVRVMLAVNWASQWLGILNAQKTHFLMSSFIDFQIFASESCSKKVCFVVIFVLSDSEITRFLVFRFLCVKLFCQKVPLL